MFPAALAAFLSLLLFCSNTVLASPFVVTSYYENKVTTYSDYTYIRSYTTSIDFGPTYTRIVPVKPTNTAAAPLSIDTTVDQYYTDVTVVNVLLPTGAGEVITRDYSATSYYDYYIKLSYTAPTSCATEWVYTTTANADLPPMITPTPTSVSTSVSQYQAFGTKTTYYFAYIDPAILPTSSLASIKSEYAPYFTSSCTVPYSYQTNLVTPGTGGSNSGSSDSGSSSSGSGSSSSGDDGCYEDYSGYYNQFQHKFKCPDGSTYTTGLSDLSIALIIIFGWLGLFLIIGLIESYIAFSRLCRGRHARRGLPISFAFLFPFLSCFFLCCHQRGFQGKSAEEQETLKAAWKETGAFTKLGRWLKWGFRYKYPDFLGAAPLRRRKWQDKDTPIPVGANAMPPMTGPMGPMPPPGSMYVVGNPADVAQRGSVYPPPPGAPGGSWYAPQPVDANGNPVPMQYQYVYPPQQAYAQQQGQGAPEVVPGSVPGPQSGPSSGAPSGPPPGIPRSLQPGQGSPPLPTRPAPAHIGAEEQTRSLPTDSPVSPASALAGSPVATGAVPVVAGGEVVAGSEVVHEADAGEVREGKGKGPAVA
ncbi:hypothetical protein VE01_07193 [Pseudogymnoascus verrucosus]|uniref:Uncharacterized protein n=1 Tax=Pseudogymnoascus verrucosus TaxID=342668 RepID=A0A1B8GF87_9PEZI|nr:uncharacterized protein VE01_07193 [Pseudogymnoascus verrucosus]OBT94494.1 hypothetical protein VE01_07193 [Pseudogymnoascus verrucosus]